MAVENEKLESERPFEPQIGGNVSTVELSSIEQAIAFIHGLEDPDFAFDEGATLISRAVWVGSKL